MSPEDIERRIDGLRLLAEHDPRKAVVVELDLMRDVLRSIRHWTKADSFSHMMAEKALACAKLEYDRWA